jgi:serine/threonine protein kinase
MAASNSCATSGPSTSSWLSLGHEEECREIVTEFESLVKTNHKFKEKVDEKLSENYLGFVLQKGLKRPVWVTPTKECYPIFYDRVIAHCKGGTKIWVCAADLSKKKLRALAKIQQTARLADRAYPQAWYEYRLLTEKKIGPKCLGYHETRIQSFNGFNYKVMHESYILQAKYDHDLIAFLHTQSLTHEGNKSKLESIANFLSAHMIFSVAELHAKKIIHRDIKLENFLIKKSKNGSYKLKITDCEFAHSPGVSRSAPGTKEAVSPQYAFEILTQCPHKTFTVSVYNDAWAAGIAMLKMRSYYGLSKRFDFLENVMLDKKIVFDKIYSLFKTPDWISTEEPEDPFEKMMWRLLRVSETERWTVQQARDYIAPFAPACFSV